MSRARLLMSLLLALLAMGASCGDRSAPEEGSGETSESAEGAESPPSPGQRDTASAEAIPLPELPSADAVAPERTAPTITDLAGAEAAFRAGFYEEVAAALPGLGNDGRWLAARHAYMTGEYDETVRLATALSSGTSAVAINAKVLAAEAHMARGRLDEAEAILSPLESNANAHRAHFVLGHLHSRRGRRVEARNAYMMLIGAYNDERISDQADGLAYVGMAAWGLGAARDANDAFGESLRAEAGRIETLIAWARVFLAKYDSGHAEENVRDVLAINPNHAEALALMARIRIAQSYNFAAAEDLCARALAINPKLVAAHVVLAGIALRDLDISGADAHLDRALAVDPNDLRALSTRAAVRYLSDDESAYEAARREVFNRHRTFSDFYEVIGEFAEWEHRYPDIVTQSREAIALNSRDGGALARLGLNLLRMGDEEEGLEALHSAWRRDRFNVRVFNTLNLYDDVIPQNYTTVPSGPFQFRFHNDEREVLERYVPQTLTRAYRDMVRRYDFTPEGPVRVELYNDTGHFAVRTTGEPRLGVQGVCFGKVVTAISPAGGPFNWGQIDWHELAHVFHIQLSQNHVPRWFTEGLAEYETLIARPEWKREMDHILYQALQSDRLPPLRLMNRAFTRARSAMGVMTAYYASTRIVKYIAEEHGFDKVVRMLRAWGAGQRTEEVFQRVLGMDVNALDRAFRAHATQRLAARANDFSVDFENYTDLEALAAAAAAAPQDSAAMAAHAAAMLVSGDAAGAERVATAALAITPAEPVAHFTLARIHAARQEGADAERHIRAIVESGRDGYELRLLLARSALGRQEHAAALTELRAATAIDGERVEAWHGIRDVAGSQDDAAGVRSALERIVNIDEHDRASNAALLAILVEAEEWDEALRVGEMAPFVDPHNAQSHRLLAQVYLAKDQNDKALYEADTALIAGHEDVGEVQLIRVRALRALGRRRDASTAGAAAVAADAALAPRVERALGRNP